MGWRNDKKITGDPKDANHPRATRVKSLKTDFFCYLLPVPLLALFPVFVQY